MCINKVVFSIEFGIENTLVENFCKENDLVFNLKNQEEVVKMMALQNLKVVLLKEELNENDFKVTINGE